MVGPRIDYNAQAVAATRQVMLEVVRILGEYHESIVIVGGWVPELLLAATGAKHIGSNDVDKALLRQVPDGELSGAGWQEVRAGLEVKRVPLDDPHHKEAHETLILCRSEDRVAKESAMLDRFVAGLEKGLEALKKSAESGRLKDLAIAQQRLGRLKEKNWRAAACFQVSITALDPPVGKAKLRVEWQKNTQDKRKVCGRSSRPSRAGMWFCPPVTPKARPAPIGWCAA